MPAEHRRPRFGRRPAGLADQQGDQLGQRLRRDDKVVSRMVAQGLWVSGPPVVSQFEFPGFYSSQYPTPHVERDAPRAILGA